MFNPGKFQVKKKQFMKHCFSKTYKLSELCISKSAKDDIQALNFNGFFKQSDTAKSVSIHQDPLNQSARVDTAGLFACLPTTLSETRLYL